MWPTNPGPEWIQSVRAVVEDPYAYTPQCADGVDLEHGDRIFYSPPTGQHPVGVYRAYCDQPLLAPTPRIGGARPGYMPPDMPLHNTGYGHPVATSSTQIIGLQEDARRGAFRTVAFRVREGYRFGGRVGIWNPATEDPLAAQVRWMPVIPDEVIEAFSNPKVFASALAHMSQTDRETILVMFDALEAAGEP